MVLKLNTLFVTGKLFTAKNKIGNQLELSACNGVFFQINSSFLRWRCMLVTNVIVFGILSEFCHFYQKLLIFDGSLNILWFPMSFWLHALQTANGPRLVANVIVFGILSEFGQSIF